VRAIWSGFGGGCENQSEGAPTGFFDAAAARWVVSQSSLPNVMCLAVSQTSDPNGAYHRYAFNAGDRSPRQPKLGVWPDGYYETANLFDNTGAHFLGTRVCAYDRVSMLAGAKASRQCFRTGDTYGGLLPADLDGNKPPAAGSPNYIVALDARPSSSVLQYWRFFVDWTAPANSTFTGPTPLAVEPYTIACNKAAHADCVRVGSNLESLADRAMYRLSYRNYGDHEALVFNHTVQVGSGRAVHSGTRWYELRPSGGALTVFGQGTYARDDGWRFNGHPPPDDAGGGFSVSSSTLSPAVPAVERAPNN
jgi:hypothetical protein